MQVNIYVQDKFYKTVLVEHPEQYRPSDLVKMVHKDRDQGSIIDYNPARPLTLRFEPVK